MFKYTSVSYPDQVVFALCIDYIHGGLRCRLLQVESVATILKSSYSTELSKAAGISDNSHITITSALITVILLSDRPGLSSWKTVQIHKFLEGEDERYLGFLLEFHLFSG